MRIFTLTAISTAALTLAACGSSSESVSDNDLPTKYDSLEGLVDAVQGGALGEASEALMAGNASLSGALEISDVDDEGQLNALGDLSLLADFTAGSVSGSVTNVGLYSTETEELDTALTGSLAVAGTISGAALAADANGTLTDDEDHAVALKMDGVFYDYNGDLATYGDVEGTIDGQDVDGGFAAIED